MHTCEWRLKYSSQFCLSVSCLGLPRAGKWREVLNSDAGIYGGGNTGNWGGVTAGNHPCHSQPCSAEFYPPPLSVAAFTPDF